MTNRILIIDDDPVLTMLLAGILKKSGYDVITAADGTSGLETTKNKKPDLVITDYQMPDFTGLEVLDKLKASHPDMPVIVLTAHGDVSLTIKAIQNGAFDFIEKPIDPKEILAAIRNGLQALERSRSKVTTIKPEVRKSLEENLLVGKAPAMREIFKNIGRVSLNRVNVLITGETGTGKERVARLIHYSGVSHDHPLAVINCGATSEEELIKELFGTVDNRLKSGVRAGKLEQAGMGTVLLNEVTLLSPTLQARLLEIIKQQRLNPMEQGASGIDFNARVIASTSQNIEPLVESGQFLKNLYYRIREFSIHVPPLRERKDDIPELVNNLLQQLNRSLGKKVSTIDKEAYPLLKNHAWPGNIRELKNILTQAMILSHGDVVQAKHILIPKPEAATISDHPDTPLLTIAEVEKQHISMVLRRTNWNKQEAAAALGITRPTLNAKIEKYQIV